MIIHPEAQGTLEWLVARAGIPTASEFDSLLTPEFAIRKGEMPKSFLARKLAEKWVGGPLPGFNVLDVEFGKILEDEAIPFFELDRGLSIQRVGLVTTDDGKVGCSPDGLVGEDCGVEIKCPRMETHVKYLLENVVPKDYVAQVHGALYVTGRPRWIFASYCRRFPALVIEVKRDESIQAKIAEALAGFLEQFEASYARLEEINGGAPKRKPLQYVKPEFVSEMPS